MVTKKYYVIGLIAVAAGIAFFLFVFETQEKKIKKQFEFVAEKLEKSPGESPLISAGKAKRLVTVFIDPSFIDIPGVSFSRDVSLDDLSTYILAMRSQYAQISMEFYDFFIDHIAEKTAQVTVTTDVQGVLKSGDIVEDIHEVKCTLQESEGVWHFKKIEVVEILKK